MSFAINIICSIAYGLICVACYRVGLQDGEEYMLDFINELDGEDEGNE